MTVRRSILWDASLRALRRGGGRLGGTGRAVLGVGLILGIEAALILLLNEGRFVYSLDDPYIHLAVADSLAQGHYGLHPGEAAAPASSALWPFLLAPWGGTAVLEIVPLLLNALLCMASVACVASGLSRPSPLRARDLDRSSAWVPLAALSWALVWNLSTLAVPALAHSLLLDALAAVACLGLARVAVGRGRVSWLRVARADSSRVTPTRAPARLEGAESPSRPPVEASDGAPLGVGAVAVLSLVWAALVNAVGLVFTGLEHSLQLFLGVLVLAGTLRVLEGGRMPLWGWLALGLGPLVRYESAALTLPVLVLLMFRGEARGAWLCGAACAGALAAFSGLLWSLDLGLLPTSVLAKSTLGGSEGVLGRVASLPAHLASNLVDPHGRILLAWAVVLGWLGWTGRQDPGRLGLVAVALAAITTQLLLGELGWFGRYEAYLLGFVLCAACGLLRGELRLLTAAPIGVRTGIVLALGVLHFPQTGATALTPLASNNIFEQQYQMHRLVQALAPIRVAVRDLGWVAFRNPGYTLDLNGLASRRVLSVLRTPGKPADWVDRLLEEHAIELVAVPAHWGERHARPRWERLGTLELSRPRVTPTTRRIAFYALEPRVAGRVRSVLRGYRAGLPRRITLQSPD